jgi:hypothetical protein
MDPDHQLLNKELWLGLCKAQVGCATSCHCMRTDHDATDHGVLDH